MAGESRQWGRQVALLEQDPSPVSWKGGTRGISPSCLWSCLFWELGKTTRPDRRIQRVGVNHSVDALSRRSKEGQMWKEVNVGSPWRKASVVPRIQDILPPQRNVRRRHPLKPAAPLILCITKACPNSVSFPAARAPSPWGQHSLPKIISDIWGQTCHSEESCCLGLTALLIFYGSSTASLEY